MSFREWIQQTVNNVRSDGIDGVRDAGYQLWKGGFRRLDWFDKGTPIYERDWDVLIVLDACRYDLMSQVYKEYNYLQSLEKFHSVGSTSSEWMERSFSEKYKEDIRETIYITGNPNTQNHLPIRDFYKLDEVWKYNWDDDLGTIHPDVLNDRSISLHRKFDPERMIIHYMQPHYPFIQGKMGDGIGWEGGKEVWTLLQEGQVELEEVWRNYRDNLRYVLDNLPILLNNIDAEKVIITTDHGNLVGEYGIYGHPAKIALPELRQVPWCEVAARDTHSHEPSLEDEVKKIDDETVAQRLQDLGYK